MPVDWGSVRTSSKKTINFFGEARDFGVANQGLTFPIRGVRGETAMFTINCEMPDQEWQRRRREIMHSFWIVACSFHQSVLEGECSILSPTVKLTPREIEVLKWAAAGKSYWETSVILGVSERNIDFMMSNIRGKLCASNKAEAVVKAKRLHLI